MCTHSSLILTVPSSQVHPGIIPSSTYTHSSQFLTVLYLHPKYILGSGPVQHMYTHSYRFITVPSSQVHPGIIPSSTYTTYIHSFQFLTVPSSQVHLQCFIEGMPWYSLPLTTSHPLSPPPPPPKKKKIEKI